MRRLLPILILLAPAGCQTTVGSYFANRGRDLSECFRAQVGFGYGLGVCARAGGVADVGLAVGTYSRRHGVGWHYGDGYLLGLGETGNQKEWEVNFTILQPLTFVALPFLALGGFEIHGPSNPAWFFLVPPHWEMRKEEVHEDPPGPEGATSHDKDSRPRPWHVTQASWAVLPGFLTFLEGSTTGDIDHLWIGTDPVTATTRKARVHACDVEVSLLVGIVHARAGFSPGEFLDFLLGWVGADIAGDDT